MEDLTCIHDAQHKLHRSHTEELIRVQQEVVPTQRENKTKTLHFQHLSQTHCQHAASVCVCVLYGKQQVFVF